MTPTIVIDKDLFTYNVKTGVYMRNNVVISTEQLEYYGFDSKLNYNCTDCVNCYGCKDCTDCTGCVNCIGCTNCKGALNMNGKSNWQPTLK